MEKNYKKFLKKKVIKKTRFIGRFKGATFKF